jgi:hypothetical protein
MGQRSPNDSRQEKQKPTKEQDDNGHILLLEK